MGSAILGTREKPIAIFSVKECAALDEEHANIRICACRFLLMVEFTWMFSCFSFTDFPTSIL